MFAGSSDSDGTFSHKVHLEALAVKCVDCHQPVNDSSVPGKYMALVDVNICAKCHPGQEQAYKTNLEKFLFPRRVGTFHHAEHGANTDASCVQCHTTIPLSSKASDRNVPTMESCWTCHSNLTTLEGRNGAECALCHTPIDFDFATTEKRRAFAEVIQDQVPPEDVPSEVMPAAHAKLLRGIWTGSIDEQMVPPDHSAQFKRSSHGRRSMAPAAKCYACHFQRDCNECHTTSRPLDHTLRFENSTHGRLAAQRARRCTTCHTVDQCDTCHNIAPPGHNLSFRTTGSHRRDAQRNVRACFACHTFQTDCAQCHNR